MLPVGDDLESEGWRPRATNGLALLLLVVFAYTHLILEPAERGALFQAHGLVPSKLLASPASAWPSLLSHLVLHGSLVHVLGNVLFLWVFGRRVEAELRWFFLPAVLFLGVVAGIGSALLRPDAQIPSIGASGAVSGVLGAYFVLFPEANVRLFIIFLAPLAWLLRIGTPVLDAPAWVFLPVWLGLQIVGGLEDLLSPSGVDYGAHLAGFVGGYALLRGLRASFGLWPDQQVRHLGWDPLWQPPSSRRGPYLAAKRPLPVGHVLEPQDLLVVERPTTHLAPDAVLPRDRAALLGRRLLVTRYRFEPLLWSDVNHDE